jgi:hypothetical protein
MSNNVWTVCVPAGAEQGYRKQTNPVPPLEIPPSHLEWKIWPTCQPFSDEVCYSPDSWLVIAQLVQWDKLSLWLDHDPTDWAHKFITPIVLAGGLERKEQIINEVTQICSTTNVNVKPSTRFPHDSAKQCAFSSPCPKCHIVTPVTMLHCSPDNLAAILNAAVEIFILKVILSLEAVCVQQ